MDEDDLVQQLGRMQLQAARRRRAAGPDDRQVHYLEDEMAALRKRLDLKDHQHVVYMNGTKRYEIKGVGRHK